MAIAIGPDGRPIDTITGLPVADPSVVQAPAPGPDMSGGPTAGDVLSAPFKAVWNAASAPPEGLPVASGPPTPTAQQMSSLAPPASGADSGPATDSIADVPADAGAMSMKPPPDNFTSAAPNFTPAQPASPAGSAQTLALAGRPQGGGMAGGGGGKAPGHRIAGTEPGNYGQTPTEQQWHDQVYGHLMSQAEFGTAEAYNQAELAAKQSAAYADAAQKYSAALEEQKQREADRQVWVHTAIDKHEQIANSLAQQEIDPDHFFTSKGTAGGIMAGLGMAFSGIGDAILMAAGHQGGGHFMERAMGLVDRDIAIQKANIAMKRDALGAQMGVYAERYRAFGDERVAEASARASIFDWLSVQAKTYQAQAFEQTTKLAVGQIAEQLTFQAAQYKNGITIASEHAYDDNEAKKIAAYWAQVSAYNERLRKAQEEQNKFMRDLNGKLFDPANAPPGAKYIVQIPSGPDKGQMAWIMGPDAAGNPSYTMPAGGFNTGTVDGGRYGTVIGMPPGIKPGSKEATHLEGRMAAVNWGGKEFTLIAHNEPQATKLTGSLMEGQNYIAALKGVLEIMDSNADQYDKWQAYDQAVTRANVSYKQLYGLGAWDNGVQSLVKGALPSYTKASLTPGTARTLLENEINQSQQMVKAAIQTYSMPGTLARLPPLSGGGKWESLGAEKVK